MIYLERGFMTINKYLSVSVFITVLFLLVLQSSENTPKRNASITADELSHHVHFLASDNLEGRRAGTPEAYQAAEYIAREFIAYGLLPHPNAGTSTDAEDYFQPFEFTSGVEMGDKNALTFRLEGEAMPLTVDKEFRTLPFSASSSVSGDVVFAGFGISAHGENYNDYDGINVEGKIALIFQGSPDINNPHGILNRFATPRNKTIGAQDAGARALIIITAPEEGDTLLMRVRTDRNPALSGIPVVNISPKIGDIILRQSGYTTSELYDELLDRRTPNSFPLNGIYADIQTDLYTVSSTDQNVIGFLPGNHPEKMYEYIIIGAHYDHLGWGSQGSMVPDVSAIHHGADDNASGTAGMLELAQKFSANRDQIERSIVFMAFGAEELGLIGSQYYVENPTIPNEQITAMINLDMIGRMQNNELTIFGVGTSPVWGSVIESSSYYEDFTVRTNPDGFGPSDHASFYAKGIPVLFFHTGLHEDYHRPSDTADKINYEGIEDIVKFVYEIAYSVNTYREPVAFTRADSPQPRGTMGNIRVYVGTMPDYVGESGGLRITGVRSDSPAEKAGIKTGDVIIKFGDREIENVYDYTYALGEHNPGDVIEVVIIRDDEELTLELELAARQQ
jgi:aminopeptidase YwaD